MKLEEILSNVDPRWQPEFLNFVNTGEGSDEFLKYLDNDPQGQKAVDLAFTAQAAAFEGLREEFKRSQSTGTQITAESIATEPAVVASESLAQAMEGVARLPYEQRVEAVRKTVSTLESSPDTEQQKTARALAETLERALVSHV